MHPSDEIRIRHTKDGYHWRLCDSFAGPTPTDPDGCEATAGEALEAAMLASAERSLAYAAAE